MNRRRIFLLAAPILLLLACRGTAPESPLAARSDGSGASTVAPSTPGPGPEGHPVTPSSTLPMPAPSANDALVHFARRVEIAELEGVERPTGPTSAELRRRQEAREQDLPYGVRLQTSCGDNWCMDGLSAGANVLILAEPDAAELEGLAAPDAWAERVIRVAWQDESRLSVYVATSEFSGGAHANNTLQCRTFDTTTGRSLALHDVLRPELADLLLGRMRALLDPTTAIAELGEDPQASGFNLTPQGFRFGPAADRRGTRPELILCAEGEYPRESSSIVELRVEAVPVGYLLQSDSL